jgi:hypothetical protein
MTFRKGKTIEIGKRLVVSGHFRGGKEERRG